MLSLTPHPILTCLVPLRQRPPQRERQLCPVHLCGHVTVTRSPQFASGSSGLCVLWGGPRVKGHLSLPAESHPVVSLPRNPACALPGHPSPAPAPGDHSSVTVPTAVPFPECHGDGITGEWTVQIGCFPLEMGTLGSSSTSHGPRAHLSLLPSDVPLCARTAVCPPPAHKAVTEGRAQRRAHVGEFLRRPIAAPP